MDFQKSTISNGLPVLTIAPANPDVTALLFLVRAGSRYETPETDGLARFYGNMCLKKTANFPERLALAAAVDNIGAYFNLEINKEYAAFYIKTPTANFETALQILAEMIINPVFDINDIATEKRYFNSEIDARLNNQDQIAFDELHQLIFSYHPLSHSGIGSKSAVTTFNTEMLNQFKNQFYNCANSLLVICGADEQADKKADQYFKALAKGEPANYEPFSLENLAGQSKTMPLPLAMANPASSPATRQTSFAIGFPALPRTSPEKYSQLLLNTILSKTKSNRRLISITGDEMLASYIGSQIYLFADCGLLIVQLRSSQQYCQQAYTRTLEEISRLTREPVVEDELNKAKGFYQGTMILNIADAVEKAFFYGLQDFLEGDIITAHDYFNQLNSVTSADIQNLSAKLFHESKLSVVMVGGE